jgi:glycosyltransferase involved in cell wall biosynthesis
MTWNEKNKIVMAGPFPPPVHGLSTTNAEVHKNLVALGADVSVLNTSAPSLDRSLLQRLGRLPAIMRGLRQLATMPISPRTAFYLSVSGGWGQIYDVLYLLLARMRKMRVFIRHCSFAYLEQPTWLARLLVASAGRRAVHVTQSKGMAERLQALYGAGHVVPISNAVLYPKELGAGRYRMAVTKLGFLSNLSAEKGVFEFLDLMAAAKEAGLPITGMLAGAYQDQDTRERVEERLRSLCHVDYLGAVYGAEKGRFFEAIDVLVFPTRYRNETEAKVNHEALSRGIPVIAYGRGCIPEIVSADCGLVIDPAAPFVPAALAKLESWLADPAAFAAASRAAAARFARTYDENEARWRALLADLTGVAAAPEPAPAAGGGMK